MELLRILNSDGREQMRERIQLRNRPRLAVSCSDLRAIASELASNGKERGLFLSDPAHYLSHKSVPAADCRLLEGAVHAQTSEICTVEAVCNVQANVNVNVNAAAVVNVYVGANVATYVDVATSFVAVTSTYVYSTTHFFGVEDGTAEEAMLMARTGGWGQGIV